MSFFINFGGGSGDMSKAVYDTDGNLIIDSSEKLVNPTNNQEVSASEVYDVLQKYQSILKHFTDESGALLYKGLPIGTGEGSEIVFIKEILEYDSLSDFPSIGESAKLYINKTENMVYRFDTSLGQYISLTNSDFENTIETILNNQDSLFSSQGRVKIGESDSLDYLENKIDNRTLKIVSSQIMAKTLDGLTVGVDKLNLLMGATANIQEQINSLSSLANFTGSVNSYSDITSTIANPVAKDMVIVIDDETRSNATTIYVYNGTTWVFSGNFEATIRDFTTEPIDLNAETTGILAESKIDNLVARKSDLVNLATKADLEGVSFEEKGNIGSKVVLENTLINNGVPVYNSTTGKFEFKEYSTTESTWDNF